MSNKRGRHTNRGGRTTPKGTRPLHVVRNDADLPLRPPGAASRAEPELGQLVRRALASGGPLGLLTLASSTLWALRSPPGPGRPRLPPVGEMVEMWCGVDDDVTTALLAALAELAPDSGPRAVVAAEVARRNRRLPAWVAGLAHASVTRAVQVSHLLGDGDAFLLELAVPGARGLTIDVYVDHNLGTVVKDAFVAPEPLEPVLHRMADLLADPHTTVGELDLAVARAKISEALASPLSGGILSDDGDAWPQCRPLVEWVLRLLPAGGTGYERHEWTEAEQNRLVTEFFASPYGRAMRDRPRQRLLQHLLDLLNDDETDLMRWSHVTVEVLIVDRLDNDDELDASDLGAAPDLIRAFIGFCHRERSIPADLTEITLTAVDHWAARALTRKIADLDRLDDGDYPWSYEETVLKDLVREVGSDAALRTLDGEPLPDEPFAWDAVPVDTHEHLRPLLEVVDATCDALFDVEVRTAARRLLVKVALGDPQVLRRGRTDTAAAALVWIVASANDSFARANILVKELMAHLGLTSGAPSQRADTFLRAAGIDTFRYPTVALADPALLTSARRRWVIDRRERCEAALRDGTDLLTSLLDE